MNLIPSYLISSVKASSMSETAVTPEKTLLASPRTARRAKSSASANALDTRYASTQKVNNVVTETRSHSCRSTLRSSPLMNVTSSPRPWGPWYTASFLTRRPHRTHSSQRLLLTPAAG